jgi:hypothetical protein
MMASQPTLAVWAHTLNNQQGSDSQMPGYYLYLWSWARLFGIGGLALRLSNLPWLVLFMGSLAWTSNHVLKVRRAWLPICVSPFLWAYTNEARPYLLIMALSMTAVGGVLGYLWNARSARRLPWIAVSVILVLWFIHMLTITLVPSLAILAWFLLPRPLPVARLLKDWRKPLLTLLPLYLALAAYFAFTIASGRGGQREKPGISNLAFALYEFLGMDGLGPPRDMLRVGGLRSFLPYLGWVALGVIALAVVAWVATVQWKQPGEKALKTALLWSLCSGLLLLLALSYAAGFRLVGRHASVFFPLFAILLLVAMLPAGSTSAKPATAALAILALAWFVSDVRERLLPKYQKDDYRDAVVLARAAQQEGYEVLWLADPVTARYYGLPLKETLTSSGHSDLSTDHFPTKCVPKAVQEELDQHRKIFAVLTDRPYFDDAGECRRMIEAAPGQQLPSLLAFDLWRVQKP